MVYEFRLNNEDYAEFNEKGLFNQQLDEGCDLFGADCSYITQDQRVPDDIFGEYLGKILKDSRQINLLCDQFEQDFQSEDGALFSKFGPQLNFSEATFWCSEDYLTEHGITPQVSDLIYYKKINTTFEILKITNQDRFKIKFDCNLYEYDNIKIDPDTITDQPILDLTNINDTEVTKIIQPIKDQVTSEAIKTGNRTNNLY